MRPFSYLRAGDVTEAVREAFAAGTKFIAGGTNLLDLMKEDVERPMRLIDINHLPLDRIEETPTGGLRLGALVRNSDAAYDPRVADRYPLLASALLAGASPQLRNAATIGGNIMQRTRCWGQSHPCHPGRQRQLHRNPPIGHVRRPGGAECGSAAR